MKKLIIIITIFICSSMMAQRGKVATMAPILSKGYYVNLRGDTVLGKIQINPPNTTDFYEQFFFQAKNAKKPKLFTAKNAKGYGFDDRHFVAADLNAKKLFIERLATGRLRFYELRVSEKATNESEMETVYFIKDTQAETADADLKKLKKISPKFYKKILKPFMKDQPAIWDELDKYNFNEQNIISVVNQFNSYYSQK
ncbi:MAG: hypothetical protein Q8L81_05220 [Bacteroidota bacterium]|nr:hypothetical protein [Bacteroidota bacterium]